MCAFVTVSKPRGPGRRRSNALFEAALKDLEQPEARAEQRKKATTARKVAEAAATAADDDDHQLPPPPVRRREEEPSQGLGSNV